MATYNGKIVQYAATSAANTAQTVTATPAKAYRVLWVSLNCSGGTATLTLNLDAIAGAAYDLTIDSVATQAETFWQPSSDLILAPGDEFDAVAGAAGASNTTSVIVTVQLI